MKKILSVILAVVIALTASVNAFAASVKKTYISDIVAITADTENKAEALLIKAGYKMLKNCNVNSTLKTAVYIGYKETENPDEAITDIAGMNMTGKFSYSDYKRIMENNKEQIAQTIDNFLPVIAEYQVNYEAEKPAALAAYKALNVFKDDDSGKLMGDYLLDFDFSDAAEKKMTDTFMQANSQIIVTIMEQASLAGDDEDDTMIDRLQEIGPDGVLEKYTGVYPTVAKAKQAMAAEYGDTAAEIYKDWNSVFQYISETEAELVKENKDGEIELSDDIYQETESKEIENVSEGANKCLNGMNDAIDTVSATADFSNYSLYNLLNDTEYGDGTLLDFFNRPAGDVKKEEIYPLVEAMSEGQRSQIGMNGLKLTLESAFCSVEGETEEAEGAVETVETVAENMEVISIFEGVDRSVFEDGVAFTSAAAEHEQLTGQSWLGKLTGEKDEEYLWLKTMIVTSVLTGVFLASFIGAYRVASTAQGAVNTAKEAYDAASKEVLRMQDFVDGKLGNASYFRDFQIYDIFEKSADGGQVMTQEFVAVYNEVYENESNALEAYNRLKNANAGRTANIIKCVSFVMLAIMVVVDAYVVYEYLTAEELQEEKIPHHLMTTATTEYGEDYVYYQTVKNLNGEAADTNNHEADKKIGWLVLYTTKDKAAGDPILADNLKIQTGSTDFKEGTSFVHLFNETAALNLTAELYTGVKDSANGTYLVFDRDTSTLIGSAITNGTAAIIGVGGLAVGAVLGAIIAKLAGKKKNKETAAEA